METRKKLNEAKYFLDLLPDFQDDEDKFSYNLDAFLNAWRSVLDIMLYDFAEHFLLGFTREVEMNDKEFYAVAKALNKNEAIDFIKWWRKKQGILKNEPLWEKRIISFHRGAVPIYFNYFGYGTGSSSGTISADAALVLSVPITMGPPTPQTVPMPQMEINFWSFKDFPNEDLIDKCKEGCTKLEEIVAEAETTFNISLETNERAE